MDTSGGVLLNERPMQVVSLQEIVDNFDILTAEPSHLTVVPKGAREPTFGIHLNEGLEDATGTQLASSSQGSPGFGELGTGHTSFGAMLRQDYNPKLRGVQAYKIYDQMRRGDGQIAMTLRAYKTPVLSARWFMEPYRQADGSVTKKDQKIADFIWDNLTKWMTCSWPQFQIEALSFLDFGWYAFEKVFDIRPDGMIYWRKFAPRHPLDLQYWDYDDNGGPLSGFFYGDTNIGQSVEIPISKLMVFVNDREGGTLDGRSALRPMYKHWYYKENLYKVDAIQKERHGIGIPIIKLPPNYKDVDKTAADNLGRNLRTNEKAHVTLPPFWDVAFAELKGQPVDCMRSISHHDTLIARSVGLLGVSDTPGGANPDPEMLFVKGTRFVAEIMRDVLNKWAIPELCDINWPNNAGYPELRVRRVGDTTDWRQISFAIRNFVGAGVITPDDKLEEWVRNEMDLPAADPNSARDIATPQMPGNPMEVDPNSPAAGGVIPGSPPGAPQQSTAANMNIGPGSNGRVGADGSGAG